MGIAGNRNKLLLNYVIVLIGHPESDVLPSFKLISRNIKTCSRAYVESNIILSRLLAILYHAILFAAVFVQNISPIPLLQVCHACSLSE